MDKTQDKLSTVDEAKQRIAVISGLNNLWRKVRIACMLMRVYLWGSWVPVIACFLGQFGINSPS